MSRPLKIASWIVLALLIAAAACTAYWLLFSTFQEHDDEGYILISLKSYAAHGRLYDAVATQYGPAPYVFYDLLHRLFAFAFNHTVSRWVTVAYWLLAALASARHVQRVTRSAAFAAATFALTFAYLWPMIQEPMHPGGLIAALIAVTVVCGGEWWEHGRVTRFALLTGAVTAVLLLTKINVGVFFAGSVVLWLAGNTWRPQLANALTWVLVAGCAVLPAVLMHHLFDEPWVRLYGLLFSCAAVGIALATRRSADRSVSGKCWCSFVTAAALVGAAIVGAVMIRGTSWSALWEGVVVAPLRHPGVYALPMAWAPGAALVGLGGVALAGGCAWRNAWEHPAIVRTVVAARIAVVALLLAAALQWLPWSFNTIGMSYAVSLAWILAVPLPGSTGKHRSALWLAAVLVFQFLQAYPVAGTQVSWGTFLIVPLAIAGVHEALPSIAAARSWQRFTVAGALLAGALVALGGLARLGHANFIGSPRFEESGAENLRLGDPIGGAYRICIENAREHADVLFSLPGSYSLNLWSGVPTPTLANVTHWFSLLKPPQQQEIRNRLAATPRAMVFVQPDHLAYLAQHGFATRSSLTQWIETHFESALTLDTFELWVPRGRSIALYSTARFVPAKSSASGERADRLVLTLASLPAPVTRIEMQDMEYPRVKLPVLNQTNTRVSITPCAEDDHNLGPAESADFPFRVIAGSHVELRFVSTVPAVRWPMIVLRLRGADGALLREVRILRPRTESPKAPDGR